MKRALIVLLILAAPAWATDIKFPAPTVPPAPPPPDTPVILNKGQIYVVSSPAPFLLVCDKPELAKVIPLKIPTTIMGDFVDPQPDDDKGGRTYASGAAYVVKPTGVGEVILIASPDLTGASVTRRTVECNQAPQPPPVPPGPTPIPPGPTPPLPPDPFGGQAGAAAGTFRVLMVYDSAKRLPEDQWSILVANAPGTARAYARDHTNKGPDGYPEIRVLPDGTPVADEPGSALWKRVMSRPRNSLPWVVIGNGKTGYEGPLPATQADTLALMKKYAEMP